jgi:hypothetical protein
MDQSVTTRIDTRAHAAARPDLYAAVHKGLRLFMGDTLQRLGSTDSNDPAQLAAAIEQVQSLLATCRQHLIHENEFVHPALEARRPGTSALAAEDHDGHLAAIGALSEEAATTLQGGPAALHRLYLNLARFVAENFEHMQLEETHHNAVLWAEYDDAELLALHAALVGSIPPEEMAVFQRWMIPAVDHVERAAMFAGMRASAPAMVFDGALAAARDLLPRSEWAKLARELELPAVSGIVERW